MTRLSIADIITKIESGVCFEAVAEDYSFTIKIEAYVPFVCAAIHDGHQFRKNLWDNCYILLVVFERLMLNYNQCSLYASICQSRPS